MGTPQVQGTADGTRKVELFLPQFLSGIGGNRGVLACQTEPTDSPGVLRPPPPLRDAVFLLRGRDGAFIPERRRARQFGVLYALVRL